MVFTPVSSHSGLAMAEAAFDSTTPSRKESSRTVSCRPVAFPCSARPGERSHERSSESQATPVNHSYFPQAARRPRSDKRRGKDRHRREGKRGEESHEYISSKYSTDSETHMLIRPLRKSPANAKSRFAGPPVSISAGTAPVPVDRADRSSSLEASSDCTTGRGAETEDETVDSDPPKGSHEHECDDCENTRENERKKPSFVRVLDELSKAPYYFGKLSGREAATILQRMPDDTFLVRDSEDARSLFAITYRTSGAIGSTRVQFRNGKFSLNFSDERLPQFMSVVDLISHCMEWSVKRPICMVHINQRPHYVFLRKPLSLRSAPSLQDACRLTIWKSYNREQVETMHIPPGIRRFLLSNPFRRSIDV